MRLCFAVLFIFHFGLADGQPAPVSKSPTQVLFQVNKTPVNTDEFIYQYKKNHTKSDDFTEAKIDEYLDLLINFKLKIAEAKKRGLDTTAAFAKEFNTYKEELKKPYLAGGDDLDKLTREAYDRLTLEVQVAHILIMLKHEASPSDTLAAFNKISDLRKRAIAGESFEVLAREFSEDPSAKSNGGTLGFFTALQMVYPFEEAAYTTKQGEISPVFRTRFGYHFLKVLQQRASVGEVEVSHILLRGNTPKTKNTIFEIYDQLKGGRSWDELCKEYSEDANSKNAGGRLRPFGVGALPSVPLFEQVAFSLKNPGDISDPFQTSVGWHIIRLEKKISLLSYYDMEPGLKRRVAKDERVSISKANSLQRRKSQWNFIENDSLKKAISAKADTTLTKGHWSFKKSPGEEAKILFSFGGHHFTLGDFLLFVSKNEKSTTMSPSAYWKQLYDRFVDEKLANLEEEKLWSENPDFRMLLNEYREGILLFEIMEKEVWNKASSDSLGQRKFFADHPEKFVGGDRIEARFFGTTDKASLEAIKSKIAAHDTLRDTDLKKFKTVTNWKLYSRKDSQITDGISWVTGLQETEVNGTYYLVEVNRLVPPGPKTFEESKAAVISDYQDWLEKQWINELKHKYPVKVNKKGKKAVITSLVK
jgi:peptidyl-prolyl cis-trans isomerase SurA